MFDPSQIYRKDIDGLRAISVIGVIAFHFGFKGAPGGFIGVDVFFVISGFLLTGPLLMDVAAGRSPFLGFYDRRIRRILPALLVVIAASLVTGLILQLPGDLADTADSARYAVFGLSNFYFLNNTGYFDQSADLMVLLHTWSLAVEEQFYFVWPLLIFLLAFKFGARVRPFIIAVVVVIVTSFLLNLYLTANEPKSAFYMLPGRAWELALGALLLFPRRLKGWQAEVADAAGLALIVAGFLVIRDTVAFPGFYALYPCVGAALVIWPKDGATILGSGLGYLFPIGKISYSLYLWHWPILVYFRVYNNNLMPDAYEAAVLVVLTFVLSVLSWRFVEVPFRRMRGWRVAAGAMGAAVMLFGIGTVVLREDGFPGRLPEEVAALQSLDVMWQWDCQKEEPMPELGSRCVFGAPWEDAIHKAFLWGDSHAEHTAPLLEQLARDSDSSVMLYRECPAFLDGTITKAWQPSIPDYSLQCANSWAQAVSILQRHPEISIVILSASWSNFMTFVYHDDPKKRSLEIGLRLLAESLNALIEKIALPGRRILLIGDVPRWSNDPVPCELAAAGLPRRSCSEEETRLTSDRYNEVQKPVHRVFEVIASARSDVTAVFPAKVLCNPDYCVTRLNGEFLYRDFNHLRRNLSDQTKLDLAHLIGLDVVFTSNR